MGSIAKAMKDALEHRLFYRSISVGSLRKHPFLLALRHWGRFERRNDVPPRETSPAAKSEEKRMFSQANLSGRDIFLSAPTGAGKSLTF